MAACLVAASCSSKSPEVQASDAVAALRQPALALVPPPLHVINEVDDPCPDSSPPDIELTVHGADAQPLLVRSLERHGWRFDGEWYRGTVGGRDVQAKAALGAGNGDAVLTVVASGAGDFECSLPAHTMSPPQTP